MNENTIKSFFGFAIIVDLRNFSEIGRRLLIQKNKPLSNSVKWQIYDRIFAFLTEVLETTTRDGKEALFDYKHTGDGFLFLTRHHPSKTPNAIDSFLLLLDIYLCLSLTVPDLNLKIIDLLKENPKIVTGNRHLRYVKSLFKSESGRNWSPHIGFSVGAHCGTIFYQTYGRKNILLGNTINQAARFQALSTTFSDYNLFFSEGISKVLKEALEDPALYSDITSKWVKDLERIAIKGLGPTSVQTIDKRSIEKVKETLGPLRGV